MIYSSYEFFALEKNSRHLLNLGVPPVSQEGEERKMHEKKKKYMKTAIG